MKGLNQTTWDKGNPRKPGQVNTGGRISHPPWPRFQSNSRNKTEFHGEVHLLWIYFWMIFKMILICQQEKSNEGQKVFQLDSKLNLKGSSLLRIDHMDHMISYGPYHMDHLKYTVWHGMVTGNSSFWDIHFTAAWNTTPELNRIFLNNRKFTWLKMKNLCLMQLLNCEAFRISLWFS